MNSPTESADRLDGSIGALRRRAVDTLRSAGVEGAELDARVLLAHALKIDAAQVLGAPDTQVDAAAQARLADAIARRVAGEPAARILGVKEFWSCAFALSPDVLVPRPETETLVEAALLAKPDRDTELRVLDLGVGSGALLAAILLERPRATGIGVDASSAALEFARMNLDALGLGPRAQFVRGDWGAALFGKFDLVVVNPPYIPSHVIAALPHEVREHDPRLALDGGADGLASYRAIVTSLPRFLAPDGVAVLELGDGQEQAVATLARSAHLVVNGPAQCDLSGKARALVLRIGE
ncbi:MAG: peptide chain release factor N(5)-glutamine methyltransferase [Xanthobacteraceae bacterium]